MQTTISRIFPQNKLAMEEYLAFLKQADIKPDRNLERIYGMYDHNDKLIATGGILGATLRCLAVDDTYRGEGLMATMVSYLMDVQVSFGRYDLFLYTKKMYENIFQNLGFKTLVSVEPDVIFMENGRGRFERYLQRIQRETEACFGSAVETGNPVIAGIVMNANPMTRGHRHLIETAASAYGFVHLFLVSEDASKVPHSLRRRFVEENIRDLTNVCLHESDHYLVSRATFPSYFLADDDDVARAHAETDASVFVKIARALNISVRVVGEEPLSHTTAIYNEALDKILSGAGMRLRIIPRLATADGEPISASRVRALLADGNIDAVKALVPTSVYEYFKENPLR